MYTIVAYIHVYGFCAAANTNNLYIFKKKILRAFQPTYYGGDWTKIQSSESDGAYGQSVISLARLIRLQLAPNDQRHQ